MDNTVSANQKPELKRVLNAFDLMMMGVGCIIGVGIYILSGVASANYAGPAVIISFIIAAVLCGIVGLCYSELATIFPMSGSAYSYSYYTFGRFTGWSIGWILILEYLIASSAVAAGWASYFEKFLVAAFNIHLPAQLTHVPGSIEGQFSMNIFAFLIMFIITFISIKGMRESAMFNNIVAVFKTLVLVFFVLFCVWFIDINNWLPFIPERIATVKEAITGPWELTLLETLKATFSAEGLKSYLDSAQVWHYGWPGILTGSAVVFFTYVGFDMVSSMSEETKNPQRNMPIGIIGSLLIVTVLYIVVTLVLTGVVPPVVDGLPNPALTGHDAAAPLSIAISSVSKSTIPPLILAVGALAGVTTTLLALNLALSRIILSISRDGFLPALLAKIHPKFQTPYIATIIISFVVSFVAASLPVGRLAELCNIGTLGAFIIVCLAVVVLRVKKPKLKRAFKCPWSPVLPIFGALFCLLLMVSLPLATWTGFAIWMFLGLFIYIFYGRSRVERFPNHYEQHLESEE